MTVERVPFQYAFVDLPQQKGPADYTLVWVSSS
jgi:hypothetical protein